MPSLFTLLPGKCFRRSDLLLLGALPQLALSQTPLPSCSTCLSTQTCGPTRIQVPAAWSFHDCLVPSCPHQMPSPVSHSLAPQTPSFWWIFPQWAPRVENHGAPGRAPSADPVAALETEGMAPLPRVSCPGKTPSTSHPIRPCPAPGLPPFPREARGEPQCLAPGPHIYRIPQRLCLGPR